MQLIIAPNLYEFYTKLQRFGTKLQTSTKLPNLLYSNKSKAFKDKRGLVRPNCIPNLSPLLTPYLLRLREVWWFGIKPYI
jgi:hypothetical protein